MSEGSRITPSGQVLAWRLAGVELAAAEPLLPFFIEWGSGTPHPSRALGADANAGFGIARLGLSGDADRLRAWLDDDVYPITMDTGPPGVMNVVLSTPRGEVIIEAASRW